MYCPLWDLNSQGKVYTVLFSFLLTCVPVTGGREALDVLRQRSSVLHLLLTDLNMPDISGVDLASTIRAQHEASSLLSYNVKYPVILLLSGATEEELMETCSKACFC